MPCIYYFECPIKQKYILATGSNCLLGLLKDRKNSLFKQDTNRPDNNNQGIYTFSDIVKSKIARVYVIIYRVKMVLVVISATI